MMHRILFGLLLMLLPALGWAQARITYTPPVVYPWMTCTGTACTSTVPVYAPNGSATAPGYAFTNATGVGLYYVAGNPDLSFQIAGTTTSMTLYPYNLGMRNDMSLAWSETNDARTGAKDLFLARDGPNILQLGSDVATAAAQTISAADSTGANQPGAPLQLSGGVGGAGGEPGPLRILDIGTKPTCAAGIRGAVWYDAGGAGAPDTFEVCAKSTLDAYAWYALATIP